MHAALLYYGDFLGAYGLIGIVATIGLLTRGDRVHSVVVWLWAATLLHVIVLAVRVASGVAHGGAGLASLPVREVSALTAPGYVASVTARLTTWLVHTATVLGSIVIVWLGMWAARQRWLEEAASHRRLLRCVAAAGLGFAVAGALPMALLSLGRLHVDQATVAQVVLLHQVSGTLAGPGYVALFGLVALRLGSGHRRVWRR